MLWVHVCGVGVTQLEAVVAQIHLAVRLHAVEKGMEACWHDVSGRHRSTLGCCRSLGGSSCIRQAVEDGGHVRRGLGGGLRIRNCRAVGTHVRKP